MSKRNSIYSVKYDREVALVFVVVVFLIILCSGCMRHLQPSLDPLMPEQYPYVYGGCGCCVQENLMADTITKAEPAPALVRVSREK